MLLVDAHLDLALNAVDVNRYTDLPPRLLEGLSARGRSKADIEKIMHGNWM